ncbi:MAG: hypothetical protein H0U10_15045 [Chloroflexia bacterium]|nr:hypothetical protein [Chloroflexia bacterium]
MVFRADGESQPGPGLIGAILRYRGAAGEERIREEDRRIRDDLGASYGALVGRVRDVARRLADERKIVEVGPVDEFAQTLDHFADRLRTATYGYAGLFAELDPDPGMVEQLRRFDQGLARGVAEIEAPVAALEQALAAGGDTAAPARQGTAAARQLLARFDLRGRIVETGKPVAQESALAALSAEALGLPHAAWELDRGVALAVLGDDFVVEGKIGVAGGGSAFRLFRLSSAPEEWLFVPEETEIGLARLSPVDAPPPGEEQTLAGVPYTVAAEGDGSGEVVGAGGSSGVRPVRYSVLRGAQEPAARAVTLDWGGERQAFAGVGVHPDDLEIFGRPLGE